MLPLEDQVCSLEHSKRLEELGIQKGSLFYWFEPKDLITNNNYILMYQKELLMEDFYQSISAFTVAELGELLPATIHKIHYLANNKVKKIDYDLIFFKYRNELSYRHLTCSDQDILRLGDSLEPEINFMDDTEANLRAKMLIHLLENKLITVEEINKCLG